jgi:hypothetical protein
LTDVIIHGIEAEMKTAEKHLIRTETIMNRLRNNIDMTDENPEREELLEAGAKQLIQSRLYALGYFSITTGYFVNLAECENLRYLEMLFHSKDSTIEVKTKARNALKRLKGLDGQMMLTPDPFDPELLKLIETKTEEEIMEDIEADAI